MAIFGMDVIAAEEREKGRRKQMEDKRIKRKKVKTDADTAHAQSMELLELNTVFVLVNRYGYRADSSFANAVLQDIGIVHEGETSHVVDRNKIRRQSKKLQNAVAGSTKLTVPRSL
ncbi:hypothetical protein AVEN_80003-1 [Araneus ventricosus]|uniref:Uncharacterized protein n=1 Tax=Araneus ventricosus TaxID=182803 RepID=A0A4Y2FS84_ARAVE|nr:hypothetical protein AVEN_80003-1 [Araneus ventricosus]